MKKIPLILGILIFACIAYLAYLNNDTILSLRLYQVGTSFVVSSTLLITAAAVLSALGSLLIAVYQINSLKDRLKKQTRNYEKADIASEESQDKIKSLQAKIDTLEIALKESLSKK